MPLQYVCMCVCVSSASRVSCLLGTIISVSLPPLVQEARRGGGGEGNVTFHFQMFLKLWILKFSCVFGGGSQKFSDRNPMVERRICHVVRTLLQQY